MNKKGVAIGVIVIAIIIGVVSSLSSTETVNLDMSRTHGTISTAMGSPVLGDPSAPLTIVEFGDYQCHFCEKWFHETKPSIFTDYIETGKANLIFIDNAILGRDSFAASQASYCAEDQEMYWEYHDLLYNSQESEINGGWANSERLKAFAFSLGLDMELFESCFDSGKYSKRVQYNTQQARDHGFRSTPAFIIVGSDGQQSISGAQPFLTFQKVLDSMI